MNIAIVFYSFLAIASGFYAAYLGVTGQYEVFELISFVALSIGFLAMSSVEYVIETQQVLIDTLESLED